MSSFLCFPQFLTNHLRPGSSGVRRWWGVSSWTETCLMSVFLLRLSWYLELMSVFNFRFISIINNLYLIDLINLKCSKVLNIGTQYCLWRFWIKKLFQTSKSITGCALTSIYSLLSNTELNGTVRELISPSDQTNELAHIHESTARVFRRSRSAQ